MKKLDDAFVLKNGVEIPCVGYGTWRSPEGEETAEAVKAALAAGYRHIDTAAAYGNEASVGKAVRESGIPREEIFVTSKVWNTERGYEKTLAAFEKTMERLGLDYLDLYLVHWPANSLQYDDPDGLNLETWRAMTEIYKSGRVRSVGVSNFKIHHLEPLMRTEVIPMVNQIELHPGHPQSEIVNYCRDHGIAVEAWSPLGAGRMLSDPALADIGAKYGKSAAQVCIRWCLQYGGIPLPKSMTPSRIVENAAVFDFELSAEDMALIAALPDFGFSGHDPDEADF